MAGNAPPAGSLTPGVVNKKLIVARNSTMASTLPTMESHGDRGLIAINTAAATSKTPSSAENVYTGRML
jgi:hypothetical protein